MDGGRTDGRTDGWMDGWIDGRTDGRTDGWMDGWVDGWIDGWSVGCWAGVVGPYILDQRVNQTKHYMDRGAFEGKRSSWKTAKRRWRDDVDISGTMPSGK